MSLLNHRTEEERDRVARTYEGYGRSRRLRRAWNPNQPGNVAILGELRRLLLLEASEPIAERSPVLDVGCGGGRWLGVLAEEGVPEDRLHGIDLIPARVDAAARAMPGADVRLADGAHLPYGHASFGLVLMLTVLSSMGGRESAAAAVEEAGRVLWPNGLLAVYEPVIQNLLNRTRLTVRPDDIAEWAWPVMEVRSVMRLTVAPPLARGVSRLSSRAYDALARAPFLLTHRLTVLRRS